MVMIGRIESLIADLGIEDAIERANAYSEAGVDLVLIHSKNFQPLKEIMATGRLTKPMIVVPTLFGGTTFEEMESCGIYGAIYANQMLRVMVRSCQPLASRLLEASSLSELDDQLVKVSDIGKLVKVPSDWANELATSK